MKYVKIEQQGQSFSVLNFEKETNKLFPFYQNGAKYALCPTCGSSVQIINGRNNSVKNDSQTVYAAHTKNKVEGLTFNKMAKLKCPSYNGNVNNWQRIYKKSVSKYINDSLKTYIELNVDKIAFEIEQIIGFKCQYSKGKQSALFNKIYKSFIENKGLFIDSNQFVPEYVPRLIIERADPINCWGAIINHKTILKLKNEIYIKKSVKLKNQFLPENKTMLVGVLDNDDNPSNLEISIVFLNEKIKINKVSAKIDK